MRSISLLSVASLAAADTCSLYQIQDGTCGQSDLDCKYEKYAKDFEKGLQDGTCAAHNCTTKTGTQSIPVPVIGTITVTKYSCPAALVTAKPSAVVLATFGGQEGTTFKWSEQNDPVMGGQSVGTFNVTGGMGVFDGEVKIVPSLSAPGFTKVTAKGTFADASALLGGAAPGLTGGIQLRVRTTTPKYSGYKLSFGPANVKLGFFNEYKAPFEVPAGSDWQNVMIPFGKFSQDWSSYTGACDTKDPGIIGKQHHCCTADHTENCPTAARLSGINMMSIWSEGAAGKYHLEVDSITAIA